MSYVEAKFLRGVPPTEEIKLSGKPGTDNWEKFKKTLYKAAKDAGIAVAPPLKLKKKTKAKKK